MACVAVMIGSQEGRGTVMTFLIRLDDMLVHMRVGLASTSTWPWKAHRCCIRLGLSPKGQSLSIALGAERRVLQAWQGHGRDVTLFQSP